MADMTKHTHSRYVAGCPTCETDLMFFRLTGTAQREQAWALWTAKNAEGIAALYARTCRV